MFSIRCVLIISACECSLWYVCVGIFLFIRCYLHLFMSLCWLWLYFVHCLFVYTIYSTFMCESIQRSLYHSLFSYHSYALPGLLLYLAHLYILTWRANLDLKSHNVKSSPDLVIRSQYFFLLHIFCFVHFFLLFPFLSDSRAFFWCWKPNMPNIILFFAAVDTIQCKNVWLILMGLVPAIKAVQSCDSLFRISFIRIVI